MKTLLVPVDFSDTSANAVDYAAGFCRQFGYEKVILLKSFYDTLFDEVVMSAEFTSVGADYRQKDHEEAEVWLQGLAKSFRLRNREAEVVALTSELPMLRAIAEVLQEESPGAILVGSDNKAYDNDSYVSSHIIEIAKTSPVNVVIVPAGQEYHEITEVVIPVDSFTEGSLARLRALGARPVPGKLKLHILKLASPPGADMHQEKGESQVEQELGHERYEVHFAGESKPVDAIGGFIRNHSVQMIVALPGKYSFLQRLTHQLLADAICSNTQKPVLLIKQLL